MTAAGLLTAAREAGLTVTANEDGTLRIRGPRTAGPIARQLLDNKEDVLHELAIATLRQVLGHVEILTGPEAAQSQDDKNAWPSGTIGAAVNSDDFWA